MELAVPFRNQPWDLGAGGCFRMQACLGCFIYAAEAISPLSYEFSALIATPQCKAASIETA